MLAKSSKRKVERKKRKVNILFADVEAKLRDQY